MKKPRLCWLAGAARVAGTVSPKLAQTLSCDSNGARAPYGGAESVPIRTRALALQAAACRAPLPQKLTRRLASAARGGATLVLAAALQVVPSTAQALSCATNVVQLPANAAVGVPTDTLIWGFADYSARLIDGAGAVVPTDARLLPVSLGGDLGIQQLLIPLEPLAPETVYTVESDNSYDITFTTGAGPAEAPPALPVLLTARPRVGSVGRADWVSNALEFQHQGILIGDIGGLPAFTSVEELLIERPSLLQQASAEPEVEWLTAFSSPPVGREGCLVWPRDAGDRVDARFGALDLAGNFSGWIDVGVRLPTAQETEALVAPSEERAEGPYSKPSACSVTAGSLPASDASGSHRWLPLALAAMLVAVRRRRRVATTPDLAELFSVDDDFIRAHHAATSRAAAGERT